MMSISDRKPVIVRHVFAEDLEHEFMMIKSVVLKYPFVSMDTEFPGTIFKPDEQVVRMGNPIVNYHYMKLNVDALKIIQLGLTLSDSEGNLPDFNTPYSYAWEFNFKDFDIDKDRYVGDSIELLKHQGIDFPINKEKGIDSRDFAKMLWNSGLVLNCYGLLGNPTWITFHGAYDFGFMLKILTQSPLPFDIRSFISHLTYLFGYNIIDLKHTCKFFGLQGGLEKVSRELNVPRVVGWSHRAGSDSLLILQCFMKIIKMSNVSEIQMLPPLGLYGLV